MSADQTFKLEELAKEAGVSPRTVRYYVQRGLLPAPVFRGRDTVYGREHLIRLRGIRLLQERFLPLDAIQAELERRSPEEIERMTSAPEPPPPPKPSHTYHFPGKHDEHPYRTPGRRRVRADERAWTRTELAPGLELHLSEDADEETRDLADEIKGFIRRRGNGGTR